MISAQKFESKYFLPAVLLFMLMLISPAYAKVHEFDNFSIDVPNGWKANQEKSTVYILKNDKTASMTITIHSREGLNFEDIAKEFSKQLNGSEFEIDEDGDANFLFNDDKSYALLMESGEDFILISMTGHNTSSKNEEDMRNIINSFSSN